MKNYKGKTDKSVSLNSAGGQNGPQGNLHGASYFSPFVSRKHNWQLRTKNTDAEWLANIDLISRLQKIHLWKKRLKSLENKYWTC